MFKEETAVSSCTRLIIYEPDWACGENVIWKKRLVCIGDISYTTIKKGIKWERAQRVNRLISL